MNNESLLVSIFRFMYILKSDAGQPLREELAKSPQKIITSAFPEFLPKSELSTVSGSAATPTAQLGDEALGGPPSEGSSVPSTGAGGSSDAYFQGLSLIKILTKLMPSWLQSNRSLFDALVLVWKSPARVARLNKEQELNLVQVILFFFLQSQIVCNFGVLTLDSISPSWLWFSFIWG